MDQLSCSQGDEIAEPESISKIMEETVFTMREITVFVVLLLYV